MKKEVIEGRVWSGYIGECKNDMRCPLFIIQNPDDFEEEEENAIFVCAVLKKFAKKKIRITIQEMQGAEKMKYRKKPVVIEAICWLGTNWEEMNNFLPRPHWWLKDGSLVNNANPKQPIIIETLEGNMQANIGDWIIKGVKGEFYPCKPDIFEQTYEPVT